MFFRSNSGNEIEKTLWTNPNPTAAFSAQNVTLSDNYTNYKALRIYYRYSGSDSTEMSVIYKKEDINNWYDGTSSSGISPVGGLTYRYNTNTYTRIVRRTGPAVKNELYITHAYALGTSGTGTSYGIPTKITGIV